MKYSCIDENGKSVEASFGGIYLRAHQTLINPIMNLIVTAINRSKSLGTFETIDKIKTDDKVLNKINNTIKTLTDFAHKNVYDGKLPTLDDVKKGLKSKTWISVYKPGGTLIDESNKALLFTILWFLGIPIVKQRSGDFLKDIPDANFNLSTVKINDIEIPICIMKLRFIRNMVDISGVIGQSLYVLNIFYKDSKGNLETKTVGNFYLKK